MWTVALLFLDLDRFKTWLEGRGQPYAEKDLSQPGMAAEAKARCGVRVGPRLPI